MSCMRNEISPEKKWRVMAQKEMIAAMIWFLCQDRGETTDREVEHARAAASIRYEPR